MAEVLIKFDTVTKEAAITLAGEEIADATGVSLYKGYDYDYGSDGDSPTKWRLSINTSSRDEEAGVRRFETLTASDKGLAKAADRAPSLAADVASYLGREDT